MKQLKWSEIGISEKVKLSMSVLLIIASVVLGFVSFIVLYEIPTSVIGLNGVWLSTALGLLGIGAYVDTTMAKVQTEVKETLDKMKK